MIRLRFMAVARTTFKLPFLFSLNELMMWKDRGNGVEILFVYMGELQSSLR